MCHAHGCFFRKLVSRQLHRYDSKLLPLEAESATVPRGFKMGYPIKV